MESLALADPSPAAVRIRGLTRRFGPNTVLNGLDLDIPPGSFVALLGRSGSGKSTLLKTLAGLDTKTQGVVDVPTNRAVVFQEPRLAPWKRVLRNVTLGLRGPDPESRARAVLAEVGLSHRVDAWPLTLSGGEAQRAALARALVREPALLLLDEPFAALDALTRLKMQRLVHQLWRVRRPAVLLVTHDVDEALLLADRVLVLGEGRVTLDLPNIGTRSGSDRDRAIRRRLLEELGVELDDESERAPWDRRPATARQVRKAESFK